MHQRSGLTRRQLLQTGSIGLLIGITGCTSNSSQSQGTTTTPSSSPAATDTTSPSETEESTTQPDETTTTAEQDQKVTGQWPQFQFNNQRTGYNPDATGPTSSPPALWTAPVNNAVTAPPIIANQRVFVGDANGYLYAFQAGSGKQRWKTRPKWARQIDGLAFANGVLYSISGYLHGINPDTGQSAFQYVALNDKQQPPLIQNGTLYSSGGGTMFAYDISSEKPQERWRFKKRAITILSAPALANSSLYAGTTQGIVKINTKDGSLAWKQRIKQTEGVGTTPTIGDGTIYAVTSGVDTGQARVAALKTGNGDERWHMDLQGRHASSPALAHGKVFVQDQTGTVYAFDTATGTKQWSTTVGTWPDSLTAAPVIAESTLYIGGKDKVHAVNTNDGSPRWTFTEGADFTTAPAVADGTVIIGSKDGTIYALG